MTHDDTVLDRLGRVPKDLCTVLLEWDVLQANDATALNEKSLYSKTEEQAN